MSSNHFSYFRVKNFKRFKDLEVKNIGQFNLVLGDNSVGKTSLLEALMYDRKYEVFMSFGGEGTSFVDLFRFKRTTKDILFWSGMEERDYMNRKVWNLEHPALNPLVEFLKRYFS